ncbi:solute carrier family 22 member 4-like [Centruroides sculpturatus]|uniref:solute carrier family 22 member 4-like n=1 Tax=Centruroides sculpturatus TaxID=218467 RepID=UPI000C6D91C1|nr:solute carrier family 22 member 4-like [Centruroides sculpturatus]
MTFVAGTIWFIVKFNLYALSLNPDIAGGNVFLLLSLFYLLNYVAAGVLYVILRRFQRRRIEMFLCVFVGILSLLLTAVSKEYIWIRVGLIVLCRFFSSLASATLTVFTIELYPTVVRTVGIGFCSTCARIAIIFAPFMKDVSVKVDWRLHFIIVGVLMIITGFGVIPLPETKSTRLKDTIEKHKKVNEDQETWTASRPDTN